MTGYVVTIAINVFAYMVLRSMRNPDKTAKVPKYRRLQEWSHVVMTFFGLVGVISSRTVFGTASTATQSIMCIVLGVILCIVIVLYVWAMLLLRIERKRKRSEDQNLCYICDSDAAIYFTGTFEQCSQYLQEQAEMFTFLPQTMILTEEKYAAMFCCDIITE